MNNQMSNERIGTVIEGDKVISLKINGLNIPLKKEIDVSFFYNEFLKNFDKIREYIDFTGLTNQKDKIEEWTQSELEEFLVNLLEIQSFILKEIAFNQKIDRIELINEIKNKFPEQYPNMEGKKLAGIIAGFNRKTNNLRKEKLFFIKSRKYVINKKYYKILKSYFNSEQKQFRMMENNE